MKVEYVDHMGSDLSVVNAARVSFNNKSVPIGYGPSGVPVVDTRDSALIKFLAREGHWSPFAHTSISFRFKAPIFVARQLVKHQVGLTWNEVSRRYVKTDPDLWWPEKWRKAAENVKQGSSEEEYESHLILPLATNHAYKLVEYYNKLIDTGLCPEQARMFLPQNTYTEWIWTGSLYAWARVYKQRTDKTAQKETRDLILTMGEECAKLFPVSWKALTEKQ